VLAGGEADVRGDGVTVAVHGDIGEQQPDDAFALSLRGGGVVPDRGQVGDELSYAGPLCVSELPVLCCSRARSYASWASLRVPLRCWNRSVPAPDSPEILSDQRGPYWAGQTSCTRVLLGGMRNRRPLFGRIAFAAADAVIGGAYAGLHSCASRRSVAHGHGTRYGAR
jgi:hypothetical protein